MTPLEYIKQGLEESNRLKDEVRERTLGYILTALGLVAGLAWNDAIKSAIDLVFPADKNSLWAQFGYAIIITLAVVVLAYYLTKLFQDKK